MTLPPLTADDFRRQTGVPTEVVERLSVYARALVKWQARINLVGPQTLNDVWRRHLLDSVQLAALLPPGRPRLLDLGSGAGFPGLVLAILGVAEVHLIESNGKKVAFLREVDRIVNAGATIHPVRIEALAADFTADVVTARALAPLPQLLDFATPHLRPDGCCLFLKGQNVEEELTATHKIWHMKVERFASASNPEGVVLRLRGIDRHDGLQ